MDEPGRVYRLDDGSGWVAADDAGWLPGVFADEAAARAALIAPPLNTDTGDLPMIVVPGNTETVAVIEWALQNPDHYLAERHRDLVGDERLATAIALALVCHTEGLGLTCGLPGCMPDPMSEDVRRELGLGET
jgi:hypothetical protein